MEISVDLDVQRALDTPPSDSESSHLDTRPVTDYRDIQGSNTYSNNIHRPEENTERPGELKFSIRNILHLNDDIDDLEEPPTIEKGILKRRRIN